MGKMRIECLRYQPAGIHVSDKLPRLFEQVPQAEQLSTGDPLAAAVGPTALQYRPSASQAIHWINIEHPDESEIASLTELYGIHPVVADDIVAPLPRPHLEEYTNTLYLTLQMPMFRQGEPGRQALSLVLGSGYLITFFDAESSIRRSVRERITGNQGRIREMGADFLLCTILDEAFERSFPVIELMESSIEDLEGEIINEPSHDNLERILEAKRAITSLRHYVWPSAEVVTRLYRLRSGLISREVRFYLEDISDHGMHLTTLVNTLREMVAGLLDIYHSASGASLNKVMKVLTMISTIFIPLTFLAGLEGMNIRGMPELELPYTYPVLLFGMLSIATGMLIFFKRKKWF